MAQPPLQFHVTAPRLCDVGVNGLLQGVLISGLQPPYNIDPYLYLPGKLMLDPSWRNTVVSLMSSCCALRFYFNIITQWPVILERVHSWFVLCVACTCADWI